MDLDLEFIDESPVGGEMPECSMVPRALPDGATFPRRTSSARIAVLPRIALYTLGRLSSP